MTRGWSSIRSGSLRISCPRRFRRLWPASLRWPGPPAAALPTPAGGGAMDPPSPRRWPRWTPRLRSRPRTTLFPRGSTSAARYLFYLHGKIVEDQGLPAVSEEFGEYRYKAILEALQSYGFVIISELRPRDADSEEFAIRPRRSDRNCCNRRRVVRVDHASSAPRRGPPLPYSPRRPVADPGLSYVLLGSCHPARLQEWGPLGGSHSPATCWRYGTSPTEVSPAHARPSSKRPTERGWAATRNLCCRWGPVTGSSMRLWPSGWSRLCDGRTGHGEGWSAPALRPTPARTGGMPESRGASQLSPNVLTLVGM